MTALLSRAQTVTDLEKSDFIFEIYVEKYI